MSGGSKKKLGGKKNGPPKGGTNCSNTSDTTTSNGNEPKNDSNPLIRPSIDHTINPRNILTGFYQKNGKRVQHIVHDGALQMPNDALNVIETVSTKLSDGAALQSNTQYNLPGLDSVTRPCLDPKLETLIVTELVTEKVQIPQEQTLAHVEVPSVTGVPGSNVVENMGSTTVKMIKTSRCMAKNRRIRRIERQSEITAERIRGGGDIPNIEKPQQEPGMFNTDIDHGTETSSNPQNVINVRQIARLSYSNHTECTNDNVTATQPSVAGNINTTTFQSNREDNTSTADTSIATGLLSIPATVALEVEDSTKTLSTIGDQNVNIGDIVANSTKKSSVTDVHTSSSPKIENSLDGVDQHDFSKTSNQTAGPTVPPSANTSKSASQLVSSSSGGEISISGTIALQQTMSSKMSASTENLPLDKAATSTEDCTKMQGKEISKAQKIIYSSQSIVKPSETDENPPTSAVSMTYTSDTPVSVMKSEVIRTATSTAGKVVDFSIGMNTTSVESSDRLTEHIDTPATIPTLPVLTSSTQEAGAALTQEKQLIEDLSEAKALTSKPVPQWEQHKPGQNDEAITPESQLPPMPDWYKKDSINDIERTMLPEWFDGSSSHRTSKTYVTTRERIIEMSKALNNRNVTNTMIRRSVLGDAGSLQRLRNFLVNWGIINRDGINDSAPTTASLRPGFKKVTKFTDAMRDDVILAVAEHAAKKRKLQSSSSATSLSLDWEDIASRVGYGLSAETCLNNFVISSLKEDSSYEFDSSENSSSLLDRDTPENSISQEDFIKNLVLNANTNVLRKIINTASEATDHNQLEKRAAVFLGVHLTEAINNARGHEVDLALRLSKLLEARMQKLENRMAMLDDVEGILEAEKVTLEMERRDLYTARCRHWFGGV